MLCALRHRQAALCAVHAMRIDCPGPYESVCTTTGLRSPLLSIPHDLSPRPLALRLSFRISVFQSERKIYKERVDSPGLVRRLAVKDPVLRGTLKEYRVEAREQKGPSRGGRIGFLYLLRIFPLSLLIIYVSLSFWLFSCGTFGN